MPPFDSRVMRLRVIINKNGHPKQVLEDVRSVLEISDEENETLKALSFYNVGDTQRPGTWQTIFANDFDRITIERRR